MSIDEAIQMLKQEGYRITAPKKEKKIPTGCYRVECRDAGPFFLEGEKGEEWQTKLHYEKMGYEVIEVTFAEDQYFFI